MKKIIAITVLILASITAYGQRMIKTNDFKVIGVLKDSTSIVRGIKVKFYNREYTGWQWETDVNGVITKMYCSPDGMTDYYENSRLSYVEAKSLTQMQRNYLLDDIYRWLELVLELDNNTPDNRYTAKYNGKEYTYVLNKENGNIVIALNK